MESILDYASSTLMGAFIAYIGAYYGIRTRRNPALPIKENIILFLGLWVITAILVATYRFILTMQDGVTQSAITNVWGGLLGVVLGLIPLIITIIIGRYIVIWRSEANANKEVANKDENT